MVVSPDAEASPASGHELLERDYPPKAEKLLSVSLELFSRKDFPSVTNKDIAQAANMNSALIYYYFKNKEHLFRCTIAFAVRRAIEKYSRLRQAYDHPVYLIHAWFENNIVLSEPIRQLIKIMLDYNMGESKGSIDDLVTYFYHHEEQEILASNIRRGIEMGLFRAEDPARIARFVSVHLDGIMAASLIRRRFDLAESVHALESIFWQKLGYSGEPLD